MTPEEKNAWGRNCVPDHDAYQAGYKAAIEAAAKIAEGCGKRGSQHEFEMAQHIAAAIRQRAKQ